MLNVAVPDHKIEIEPKKNDMSRGVDWAFIEKGSNKAQTGIKRNTSFSNIKYC